MKKPNFLPLSILAALLACGCESTPSSSSSSSPANVAEGRVVNAEDGVLELRMAGGTSGYFMLPGDETTVPKSGLNSHVGRKCRIQFRKGPYEDVTGEVTQQLHITSFAWL